MPLLQRTRVEVHTARVGEGMLEDLDLLEQRERVEVGGEVHHQPVLDVEKDVARHAVVSHEGVEGVARALH